MMYRFDYLVFIGRFQPFHLAHMQTIQIALQQSQKVIIALGSAQAERSIKNPFLAQEREQMILSNFLRKINSVLFLCMLLMSMMIRNG
jgi:bifunctional NMN adenylyltransferase/nudix hydrolase